MDAMVTARMPAGKKEAGARVLKELGLTASQAINMLWDELISTGRMPTADDKKSTRDDRAKRLAEAMAWVDGFPYLQVDERYRNMSIREARAERLAQRYGITGDEPFIGSEEF